VLLLALAAGAVMADEAPASASASASATGSDAVAACLKKGFVSSLCTASNCEKLRAKASDPAVIAGERA
jgi:hypothetical protein